MTNLNQVIVEGKLELYDMTSWDNEMIISYLIGDCYYATKLKMNSNLMNKYLLFIDRTVRIVGKLAGDKLLVEHVDTID